MNICERCLERYAKNQMFAIVADLSDLTVAVSDDTIKMCNVCGAHGHCASMPPTAWELYKSEARDTKPVTTICIMYSDGDYSECETPQQAVKALKEHAIIGLKQVSLIFEGVQISVDEIFARGSYVSEVAK